MGYRNDIVSIEKAHLVIASSSLNSGPKSKAINWHAAKSQSLDVLHRQGSMYLLRQSTYSKAQGLGGDPDPYARKTRSSKAAEAWQRSLASGYK